VELPWMIIVSGKSYPARVARELIFLQTSSGKV